MSGSTTRAGHDFCALVTGRIVHLSGAVCQHHGSSAGAVSKALGTVKQECVAPVSGVVAVTGPSPQEVNAGFMGLLQGHCALVHSPDHRCPPVCGQRSSLARHRTVDSTCITHMTHVTEAWWTRQVRKGGQDSARSTELISGSEAAGGVEAECIHVGVGGSQLYFACALWRFLGLRYRALCGS
jgi:hypothetical protein